jgi:hypothetical protein
LTYVNVIFRDISYLVECLVFMTIAFYIT